MKLWKSNKRARDIGIYNNNRINIIIAIIFLLGLNVLVKLYNLQVRQYDWYMARALSQHQVSGILEPERGRIFIQENREGKDENLYPIATNKEFALIYAIPKEIKNANNIAENLFEIFQMEKIEKEVDELMKKIDDERLQNELAFISRENLGEDEKKKKEEEIVKYHAALIKDLVYLEIKNEKRSKEIESRKESAINDYLKILTKEGDPYEPIEQKVEEETLKKLYVAMAGSGSEIKAEDLFIKDEKIFFNKGNEKKELKLDGLAFMMKKHRFYPEKNIGSHILGFVGYDSGEEHGQYGLEGFFDKELFGARGSIKTERGAGGDLIIINEREYARPQNGSDLILTINKTIQFTACQKLNEAVLRHGADGGSVIIIEPKTGAILAMCSYPDYDPNNYKEVEKMEVYNNGAIFSSYEPGSIFKAITMAAALDQGKVTPDTTFNDTGAVKIANYEIKNSDQKAHGIVTMANVLEESLNVGAVFAMRKTGPEIFGQYVKNFGFGEKTGIELETESQGNVKNLTKEKINKELNAATASFGQGIAVTPLQMVSAFGAIANGGILMKPYLVKEIVRSDGAKIKAQSKEIKRVISERTSLLLGGMLVNVVENGHGKRAGVKGYYVAGKTGTAQIPKKDKRGYEPNAHIGSFVGFAPAVNPRFVMLVRIDRPRDVEWAESSAAPLFGQIAEFILNYYEVPKER
jgi:cell division protein FtsI/penicillin-binding protein 2